MLTLQALTKSAASVLDDEDPSADDAFRAWCLEHRASLAEAMAQPADDLSAALLRCPPGECARRVLDSCRSRGVRDAVKAQAARERSTAVDELAGIVAAGAVQVVPEVWSVDWTALVELAQALGRRDAAWIALDHGKQVMVRASTVLDVERANRGRAITAEVASGVLALRCEKARGYRFAGRQMAPVDLRCEVGRGNVAIVALPTVMPCEVGSSEALAA